MFTKDKLTEPAYVISFSIIFVILVGLGVFHLPPNILTVLLLASIIFTITLINTDIALIILIFSMFLSPELKIGGIRGRDVVLRADDILLLTVFLGWLAKMAINKELGLFKSTPLNRPIVGYVSVCLLATGLGVLDGHSKPKESIFYLLKYFEYFLLFFMTVNSIKSIKQVKLFIFCMFLTCFLVGAYAWWMHFSTGGRASAPFEGPFGAANTFAGYLLLMISVIVGLLLYSRQKQQVWLTGLLAFLTGPFLWTMSRGAWLGFFPATATLVLMTKRRKLLFLVMLVTLAVLSPILIPNPVRERVKTTFQPGQYYSVLGKRLAFAESGVRRIETWKTSVEKWYKRPLLGYGVPGFGVVGDSQYVRVLREVGIIGFLIFGWLMVTIFRMAVSTFKACEGNNFAQGLTIGFVAGFCGLLTQSLTAETFIIIRIMEPFWFLAAIVVMLPQICNLSETADSEKPAVCSFKQ